MLEPCVSREELLRRQPAGRWLATGNGIFWCHSPTLCGTVSWGRPRAEDVHEMMRVFEGYETLAPRFDVLMDASEIEGVDPDAIGAVVEWWGANAPRVQPHVRERIAVIPAGVNGLALAGISNALGIQDRVTILTDRRDAFRRMLPKGGEALHDEVMGIVDGVRGVSPTILALRRALTESRGALDLNGAGKKLGMSSRSLQRELAAAGRSFRVEQADARFRAAEELLRTEDKLASVAAALGLSDDGLTLLVRSRTGLTPAELRRRLRGV